ncbi:MAG: hypothetical protein WEH44_06960 [Pirellulaceae bacterium]
MSPDEQLIRDFGKLAVFVDRGLLTSREYVTSVLDTLGWSDCRPQLVPDLWGVVPVAVRDELIQALRKALLPEFRWRYCRTSGFDISEAEQAARDEDCTSRFRSWAAEFIRHMRESLAAIDQG